MQVNGQKAKSKEGWLYYSLLQYAIRFSSSQQHSRPGTLAIVLFLLCINKIILFSLFVETPSALIDIHWHTIEKKLVEFRSEIEIGQTF